MPKAFFKGQRGQIFSLAFFFIYLVLPTFQEESYVYKRREGDHPMLGDA